MSYANIYVDKICQKLNIHGYCNVLFVFVLSWSQSTKYNVLVIFKERKRSYLLCGIGFNDLIHIRSITNTEEFLH